MTEPFNHYLKDANTWLHYAQRALGIQDEEQTIRIFRAVLHALRDRMPAPEAVNLGAQLPILWKGIYFQGFKIREEPVVIRHEEEWLDFIRSQDQAGKIDFPTQDHVRLAFQDIMGLLETHLSEGLYLKVIQSLHHEIVNVLDQPVVGY
ncbi:MAG TPA: DUF2267 domain-containing protein [Adhaeribacter sp.]|nr:DUF2267 domain-containing protein [Adhaeribacter sp.]